MCARGIKIDENRGLDGPKIMWDSRDVVDVQLFMFQVLELNIPRASWQYKIEVWGVFGWLGVSLAKFGSGFFGKFSPG